MHAKTMKTYKIVSQEPIIGNSLVKIVMAPHNALEQLSKQDHHGSGKYAINKIDKNGIDAIKEHDTDVAYDGKLISNGDDVNVEVFSLEDITASKKPIKKVLHQDSNNVQIIAKSHQQPSYAISIEQKEFPLDWKVTEGSATYNRDESDNVNQAIEVDVKSIPEHDDHNKATPTIAEPIVVDSTFSKAEELLSNPTTSQQNLIPMLVLEGIEPESLVEGIDSTEIIDTSPPSNSLENSKDKEVGSSTVSTPVIVLTNVNEASTENNVTKVVLTILNNHTMLVEEAKPSHQLTLERKPTSDTQRPVVRPKRLLRPTTTIRPPVSAEDTKPSHYPKKAQSPFSKHRKPASKYDDSLELTTKTDLLDVETTQEPFDFAKSKNMKRAIGDEGKFTSNFVRPSPLRPKPKPIGSLLPRETDAERAERLSKSMQRLMHFVTIVGHVDSYVTKRFRHGLKNVARLFDSPEEDTRRRRSNL